MAYSKGPVSLADVMKVRGQSLPLSAPQRPARHEPDLRRLTAIFLSRWDTPTGPEQGGKSPRPSIHHFCTQARQPQMPLPMRILSRRAHAHCELSSMDAKEMGLSAVTSEPSSGEPEQSSGGGISVIESGSRDLTMVFDSEPSVFGSRKSVCFADMGERVVPTGSKLSRSGLSRSSRLFSAAFSSKSALSRLEEEEEKSESPDIVQLARLRLKRELRESCQSLISEPEGKDMLPKAKKPSLEIPRKTSQGQREGRGSRASLRSRGGSVQARGQSSSAVPKEEAGQGRGKGEDTSPAGEMREGTSKRLVISGIKMEVSQNPARYVD